MLGIFKKILVPVDLQEPAFADRAVAAVVEVARHQQAELHVMTVPPGFGTAVASFLPADSMKKALEQVQQELRDYVAKKVPSDVSVAEGTPYEEIVAEAKKIKADLTVLHSQVRKHVEKILLGSCAQKVVEPAPCSVLAHNRALLEARARQRGKT